MKERPGVLVAVFCVSLLGWFATWAWASQCCQEQMGCDFYRKDCIPNQQNGYTLVYDHTEEYCTTALDCPPGHNSCCDWHSVWYKVILHPAANCAQSIPGYNCRDKFLDIEVYNSECNPQTGHCPQP